MQNKRHSLKSYKSNFEQSARPPGLLALWWGDSLICLRLCFSLYFTLFASTALILVLCVSFLLLYWWRRCLVVLCEVSVTRQTARALKVKRVNLLWMECTRIARPTLIIAVRHHRISETCRVLVWGLQVTHTSLIRFGPSQNAEGRDLISN